MSRSHKAVEMVALIDPETANAMAVRMTVGSKVRFTYHGKLREGTVETPPSDGEGFVRLETSEGFRSFRIRNIEPGTFAYGLVG